LRAKGKPAIQAFNYQEGEGEGATRKAREDGDCIGQVKKERGKALAAGRAEAV